MAEAVRKATVLEAQSLVSEEPTIAQAAVASPVSELTERLARLAKRQEDLLERLLQNQFSGPRRGGQRGGRFASSGRGPQCFYCNAYGHLRRDCQKLRDDQSNDTARGSL